MLRRLLGLLILLAAGPACSDMIVSSRDATVSPVPAVGEAQAGMPASQSAAPVPRSTEKVPPPDWPVAADPAAAPRLAASRLLRFPPVQPPRDAERTMRPAAHGPPLPV